MQIERFQVDALPVQVFPDQSGIAGAVAEITRVYLQETITRQGSAAVILATGNSQIRFLETLVGMGGIDWSKVTAFHMDEYLGLSAGHPASFRRYMRERVESKLRPRAFHYIEGDALMPLDECDRYTRLLEAQPIDLCCLGIGENGHLAFNDPPVADFNDRRKIKIVQLDPACRQQQAGEGHFPSVEAVPPYAITLTIPALCSAKKMLCVAPEKRKAKAVHDALRGPVSTACPASILRQQSHAMLFLDRDSAALL